jgi:two-component system CheB/CheR fusion protein
MLGRTQIDIAGHDYADFTHPDDVRESVAGIQRIASGRVSSFRMEKRYVRKDGGIIWGDVSANCVRDGRGKPLYLVTHVQDITDRKRTEVALREGERRLLLAKEAASLAVFDHVLSSETIQWDARLREIWGFDSDEPVTMESFLSGVHPDDRSALLAAADAAMNPAGAGKFAAEHRVINRKDGREHWVAATGQVLFERGKAVRIVGAVQDITDRKRAEQALQAVSAELQRVLDTAATGLTHCSRDLRYVSVNLAYARWMGRPIERIVGRPLVEVMGRAAFEVIRPQVERVLQGERVDYEAEMPLPDGVKYVHAVYTPDRDGSGNVVGWVASVTDISGRRRAERELLAAKARAEQAQLVAESASRAKDRFMAVLSHELRNPLTPVLPALGAMEKLVPQEAREFLEIARRNVELEAKLIDDLLDVTRIARGKIELDRELADLGTILRRAAEVCGADIAARRLHFGVEIEDGPHPIHVDAARLQQVFWNLINNAVKFTPDQGRVQVRCWSEDGRAIVEVADSGEGIAAEALPRLFDAFEQESRATTRQFGGLGLGLAISKELVELHGGTIRAYSAGKGQGTTITVTLPMAERQAAEKPVTPNSGAPCAPGRKLRILLVEDHADTVRIIRRLLTAEGHSVQAADDVASALKLACGEEFDVLVSDLGLPDGGGHQLMRELLARGRQPPGIALSGYGTAEDVQRSREAGFLEHLTKPVTFEALQEALSRAVDHSAARADSIIASTPDQ